MGDGAIQRISEADADHGPAIRAEQVRRLFGAIPTIVVLTTLGALLLVWGVPRPWYDPAMLAWLIAFLLLSGLRLALMGLYRRIHPTPEEVGPWWIALLLTTFLAGVVWGSGAWLFVDDAFRDFQVPMAFIVAGLGAGSVINLGVAWQAVWLYILPMLLPYAWQLAQSDEGMSLTIAAILLLFLVAMLVMARRFSALVVEHIDTALNFADLAKRSEAEMRGYRNMVESTMAILWEGRAGSFTFDYISPEAEKLLGYPADRWLNDKSFWLSIMHPEDREWAPEFCRVSSEQGRSHVFDYRAISADGRTVWLRDYVNVVPLTDGPARLVGAMIDISELKEVEAARIYVVDLQQWIVRVSQRFLASEIGDFDRVLDEALEGLGLRCNMERAYFIRFSDDMTRYTNTHEWVAEGAASQRDLLQDQSLEPLSQMVRQLERNEPVVIHDVARLPAEWGSEREVLEQLEVRSLIALPVVAAGRLIGIIGMDTGISLHTFVDEEITTLVLLAELVGAALQHRQATKRIRQVEAMREHAEVLAGMGSWQWDIENDVFEASDEARRLIGIGEKQMLMAEILALMPEEDRAMASEHLAETLRSGRVLQIEHRIRNVGNGEERWLRVSAELDLEDDDRPLLRGFSQDITEAKKVERRMFELAHFDYLTGLPNRMFAQQQIEQALARRRREDGHVAVMFMDLDRFKKVNDTLGHECGDAILVDAARRLSGLFRENDAVARIGGDEFVVIVEDFDRPDDLAAIARKIVAAFREPLTVENHEFVLTTSIGIAVSPEDGDSASQLLQKADTAMYHAKRSGRSRYQFITPEMNEAVSRAALIEEHIHSALVRGEIRSVYQPIFCLLTGRVGAMESLMRWQHPELGNVPPDEFIRIAEQTGRILELGAHVFEEGLGRLARWRAAGHPELQLAVNMSPHQLRDPDLVDFIEQRLHHAGLPGSALEIEITENVLLAAGEDLQVTLARLRSLDVGIAMDDFGTGYSSLSYLRDYPFTAVKIDRGFVRGLDRDERKRQLVKAAIEMGHALGLKVIAEGVELDAEFAELATSEVDGLQGYLISRPLEVEHVRGWLGGDGWPEVLREFKR
ncbi:MAG: EAL domain-containing protein [Wenzhouxiangellaceae bacterium]|nr:EAL domain-containing protein [Wenzhouxiangellaceae bacterium]